MSALNVAYFIAGVVCALLVVAGIHIYHLNKEHKETFSEEDSDLNRYNTEEYKKKHGLDD